MELHERPLDHVESKFVITEDRAYFVPCLNNTPTMAEILQEILDLDDPQVFVDVDGKLFGGKIIFGYYEPSTKEVVIHTPLETSEYVENRIKDVFGNV
jgi:hypothetical protein